MVVSLPIVIHACSLFDHFSFKLKLVFRYLFKISNNERLTEKEIISFESPMIVTMLLMTYIVIFTSLILEPMVDGNTNVGKCFGMQNCIRYRIVGKKPKEIALRLMIRYN